MKIFRILGVAILSLALSQLPLSLSLAPDSLCIRQMSLWLSRSFGALDGLDSLMRSRLFKVPAPSTDGQVRFWRL